MKINVFWSVGETIFALKFELWGEVGAKMAPRRAKLWRRWAKTGPSRPRWRQDGTKMAPRWRQDGPSRPTWRQLGPNWRQLGPNLAALGPIWAPLGANLAPTWPQSGPPWPPLGLLLAPTWPNLGQGSILGRFWDHFGFIFEGFWGR